MNWQDIFQHNAFYVVGAILATLFAFWIFKAVIRFALIFLIVGFLIWHFWLS